MGRFAWSGFLFADFWERMVLPHAKPDPGAKWIRLRGADGHRATLHLEDILAPDVILADQMDGEPLPLDHGCAAALSRSHPLRVQERETSDGLRDPTSLQARPRPPRAPPGSGGFRRKRQKGARSRSSVPLSSAHRVHDSGSECGTGDFERGSIPFLMSAQGEASFLDFRNKDFPSPVG